MTIISRSPLSKPCGTTKASQTTVTVGVQNHPGSARDLAWTSIPFVLKCVLSTPVQRKHFCGQAREVAAARHAPSTVCRERKKIPHSERRRNTGLLFFGS